MAALFWGLVVLAEAGSAQTIAFVEIRGDDPLEIAPPSEPAAGARLGVWVRGLDDAEGATLSILGSTDADRDGAFSDSETRELRRVEAAELRSAPQPDRRDGRVVELPAGSTGGASQIEAYLLAAGGEWKAKPALLLLDAGAAARPGPGTLDRLVSAGRETLLRILRIYDNVREAEPGSALWVLDLEAARPAAPPRSLDLPRISASDLALSPQGRVLAWVRRAGATHRLEVSDVEDPSVRLVASSAEPIVSPRFVDESRLVFARGSELVWVELSDPPRVRAYQLPVRSILRLFEAAPTPEGSRVLMLGEAGAPGAAPDAGPGVERELSVTLTDAAVAIRPAPRFPQYLALAGLVDGSALYFVGVEGERTGLQVMALPEGTVETVVDCVEPGLVAVAASGSRVAFTADDCSGAP